ncbi:MAG: IS630 family transposase, partial [Desulfovibrionaceae bacterium]|nr:IS630 family transposase [Desulfovibrionaceae bacterium]
MVCMHRHTVHCAYVLSVSLGSDSSVWSVQAIAILLKEFFDIKVSMSFLYKFLRYTMGFSSKAATKHNPTRNLMLIRRFVEKRYREIVIQALRRGEIIVFLDEVHIASDGRCRGMAGIGRRATVEHVQGVEHSQGTILTFIGPSGLFDQTMTAELFISCLKQLFDRHRGKKFFLILDQAQAHTAKITKVFLNSKKTRKVASYEYLPPKAPELNPVEQYNSKFKDGLDRILARNQDELHMNAGKLTG